MNDVIKKTKRMENMEKEYASSLSTSVDKLNNVVVKELLNGIAQDSLKHAGFYTAIVSLLKGEEPAITEEDYDGLGEILKKHIEVENQMMDETKQMLNSEEDMRIKHIVREIYDDEVKHHTLMKRLLDVVIKRETIFEQDIWDMLWKDAPGHGTPIG